MFNKSNHHKKFTIGYKKHSKVQSFFNGKNPILNLHNFIFLPACEDTKIDSLVGIIFFVIKKKTVFALCKKTLNTWHHEFANPS